MKNDEIVASCISARGYIASVVIGDQKKTMPTFESGTEV